jgi:hypothetical protein
VRPESKEELMTKTRWRWVLAWVALAAGVLLAAMSVMLPWGLGCVAGALLAGAGGAWLTQDDRAVDNEEAD